jgi:hypothetical protein
MALKPSAKTQTETRPASPGLAEGDGKNVETVVEVGDKKED